MASYQFLGRNWFTDALAQIDPTSNKLGGKIVKGALIGVTSIVGSPAAGAAVAAGLGITSMVGSNLKKKPASGSITPETKPQGYIDTISTGRPSFQQASATSTTKTMMYVGAGVLGLGILYLLITPPKK